MGDGRERAGADKQSPRFLGSLRDALLAASKDDPTKSQPAIALPADKATHALPPPQRELTMTAIADDGSSGDSGTTLGPSAAEAAREARGGTPNIPPADRHVEFDAPPTTRVVRNAKPAGEEDAPARTRLVRGRQKIQRQQFHQDPVVGWLVVVGGPGLGSYRPIFEGNNTIGRAASQRVPIDFGDDAISGEEQAYIRYDSADRAFLFVPNLSKTNVVAVNDKRPTSAVTLQAMDVIMMGRTQLVFVPFCGSDFDWSEISENTE
ncbi:MAG: FHA domain-containing protein [Hyphomicrobiaceae bacterium]